MKFKKYRIVPHFSLPDIIELKRIDYPYIAELSTKEVIRAMNYADVYEILSDGSEVLIDPLNFNTEKSNNSETPEIPLYVLNMVGYAGVDQARL